MSGRSGGSNYGADDDGGVLGNVQEMVMGAVALMVLYCGWRFINSPTANLLGKTVNGAANTLQWSLSSPFALILSLILVAAGVVMAALGRDEWKNFLERRQERSRRRNARSMDKEDAKQAEGESKGGTGDDRLEQGRAKTTQKPRAIHQMDPFDPCSKLGEDASKIILENHPELDDLMRRHPQIDVNFLATYYDALSLDGSKAFNYKDHKTFELNMQFVKNNRTKKYGTLKYGTLTQFMENLKPEEDKRLLAKLANVYMQSSMGGIVSADNVNGRRDISLEELREALPGTEEDKDRELRKLLISAHKRNVPESLKGVKLPGSGNKTLGSFEKEGIGNIEAIMKTMRTPPEIKPEGRSNDSAGLNSTQNSAEGRREGDGPFTEGGAEAVEGR